MGLLRNEMLRKLERVFLSFGFTPIDTPALEYAEILLGKGSAETDKQLFRFLDNGGRDVALRFDLTIPLARFVAQHCNELVFPFKRFHVAPVWRAEKPQRGRFREFIQCDFDTIGSDSPTADAEILTIVHNALRELQISHQIRVNNRKILNGLLEKLNARDKSVTVLRTIDKLDKLGREIVQGELKEAAGLDDSQIGAIFEYVSLSESGLQRKELLLELKKLTGPAGVNELSRVLEASTHLGVDESVLIVDLSIARGLDYYTGTVYETRFTEIPEIGSISSGGRYDDLASLYINRKLPGVGGSIGLDRVIAGLSELERVSVKNSPAQVFVTLLDQSSETVACQIAAALREKGVATEIALEVGQLGSQLKLADRKGIPFAIILGEREVSSGVCSVKDLAAKTQEDGIPLGEVARYFVKKFLGQDLS